MIRDGDRVAVALSGGKDSATMLEALLLLQKRAPIDFSVRAFTVEQGKFLRPIEPLGEYLKARGIPWTYFRDAPSLRLLEDQPDHGCDLFGELEREHPNLKETMLSAMGNVDTSRLLDTRFLKLNDETGEPEAQIGELFPIVTEL